MIDKYDFYMDRALWCQEEIEKLFEKQIMYYEMAHQEVEDKPISKGY